MPKTTRRRRSGFTLVELLISMVVLSIVLGGTAVTLMKMQSQYTEQRGAVEAREQIRYLESMLATSLRTAGANPRRINPAPVGISVNPLGNASWDNVDLRADFNPVDGVLTGDLEDMHIRRSNDTLYLRMRAGGTLDPIVAPVTEFLLQFYTLEGAEITTTSGVSTTARRVKMTIGVRDKKTTNIIRRESWIALRN